MQSVSEPSDLESHSFRADLALRALGCSKPTGQETADSLLLHVLARLCVRMIVQPTGLFERSQHVCVCVRCVRVCVGTVLEQIVQLTGPSNEASLLLECEIVWVCADLLVFRPRFNISP